MGFQLNNIEKQQQGNKRTSDKVPLLQREIQLFGTSFSNKIKEDFYTELSVLLKAGITLKDALELTENAQKKAVHKTVLNGVASQIVSGSSLSEAINSRDEFSSYEYYSLKIGEETGTLAQVAEQLGAFYARKNEQRRELVGALTYPFIIFLTAIAVVIFMLHFVVPMFQDIFRQQKVDLPAITEFIIALSEFMKDYGWLLFVFFGVLILIRMLFKKTESYQRIKDKIVVRTPFIGSFVKTVYLSQFTQAVALLTASKVPVVNSIQLVKQMISFYPLQNALEAIEQSILQGASLSESLKEHPMFDEKMVALVKVAEETNQNEFIFERLNEQYSTQVKQRSKMLSTLMEPLVIMIIGLLVGVILIAMYLPMFKLGSVMG